MCMCVFICHSLAFTPAHTHLCFRCLVRLSAVVIAIVMRLGRDRRRHRTNALAHAHDSSAERVSSAKQTHIERRVSQLALALRTSRLLLDAVRVIDAHLQLRERPERPASQGDSEAHEPSQTTLHLVSYGLGSFCASTNAVYQLAYARALLDVLTLRVEQEGDAPLRVVAEVFDPVMNEVR